MQQEGVNTLSSIATADLSLWNDKDNTKYMEAYNNTTEKYLDVLSSYIAGSSYNKVTSTDKAATLKTYDGGSGKYFSSDSGIVFHFSDTVDIVFSNYIKQGDYARGAYKGRYQQCLIDINGIKTPPNTIGKDIFYFDIDNNGKMIAHGSHVYAFVRRSTETWDKSGSGTECSKNKVAGSGFGCAGSIMENNLKVIYR